MNWLNPSLVWYGEYNENPRQVTSPKEIPNLSTMWGQTYLDLAPGKMC